MQDPTGREVLGETLIPVINKLQDIFSQVTLDFKLSLPQVAVIGSQSSGKSSVLEALVGRDFLPRGPEICTRRPLVLQLVKVGPQPGGKVAEWGEFLHAPGKIFHDFNRIRQEISNETDRVVGTNKNVSDKPIRLKICSPNVLTMTLVDLPGITKVPVGDQPSNIEQRIREMILSYIKEPSCIILAVSPANVDLVNSDALQLAQMVDPDGTRTIGVLTKLDIMDRGTNAVAALKNLLIPLRLGYIGVVNRSQEDINRNKSMGDARQGEDGFFRHHPEYEEVVEHCGVGNLAKRLNNILVDHIRQLLPGLRKKINEAVDSRAAELRSYGDALPLESSAAKGALLLQLLCDYADRFKQYLDGRSQDVLLMELSGGARIRHIFQELFGKSLKELNPARELTDEEIRTAIKNSSGVAGTLLIPQEPFELLVRRAIVKLLDPALQCSELVYDELLKIAEAACPRELSRFPTLQKRLATAVLEYIQSGADPADQMIRHLVDCEHDYINTDHPEFIGGTRAVKVVMEEREFKRTTNARIGDGEAGTKDKDHVPPAKSKSAGNMLTGSWGNEGNPVGPRPGLNSLYEATSLGLKGLPESTSPGDLITATSRMRQRAEEEGAGSSGGSWFSWLSRAEPREHKEGALANPPDRLRAPKPRSEHEEVQVEVIRLLVQSYFDIVRRNLQDSVPKAIMHFMVNNAQKSMQQYLIMNLYKEDLFNELMSEREDIVLARAKCVAALTALQAAQRALEEIPSDLSTTVVNKQGDRLQQGTAGHPPVDRHPSMSIAAQMAYQASLALTSGKGRPLSPIRGDEAVEKAIAAGSVKVEIIS